MKIKSALISVFDKTGIDKLAIELEKNGVLLYSTGGTKKYLEGLGLSVLAVEDQTNYPEVFGGRVKTLHPAIFGGILYRRDNELDSKELKEHQIPEIDLVVVDLYPFEETVASGADHSSIIEKIDIGGISLIRAAAKNYKFISVISSKKQYEGFTNHYLSTNGSPTIDYRKKLAAEGFGITLNYDKAISSYFQNKDRVILRYGENPHQDAYFEGDFEGLFKKLNGKELSYNNLLDIDSAVSLITDLSDNRLSTFAILKHNNACGCARRETVYDAFKDALASDPVSAFGGILITDRQIDLETAEKIDKLFYEVCIATSFTKEALEVLTKKSKRIILEWSMMEYKQDVIRSCLNGELVQQRDILNVDESKLTYPTIKKPNKEEVKDLLLADKIVKNTKSNAIILVKDGRLLSSGTGQTSRVDALKQAIAKANAFNIDLKGSIMASDAFFPFPDCVEIAAEAGVEHVIQPGGSIKDSLSIEKANELGLSMVMTGIRHFKH